MQSIYIDYSCLVLLKLSPSHGAHVPNYPFQVLAFLHTINKSHGHFKLSIAFLQGRLLSPTRLSLSKRGIRLLFLYSMYFQREKAS
jgi:hypothetical protein